MDNGGAHYTRGGYSTPESIPDRPDAPFQKSRKIHLKTVTRTSWWWQWCYVLQCKTCLLLLHVYRYVICLLVVSVQFIGLFLCFCFSFLSADYCSHIRYVRFWLCFVLFALSLTTKTERYGTIYYLLSFAVTHHRTHCTQSFMRYFHIEFIDIAQ